MSELGDLGSGPRPIFFSQYHFQILNEDMIVTVVIAI